MAWQVKEFWQRCSLLAQVSCPSMVILSIAIALSSPGARVEASPGDSSVTQSVPEKLAQQQSGILSESDRAAAQRAFDEALQLSQQGTTESLRQAIQKNEEALGLWRKIGDLHQESAALNNIGHLYNLLGDKQKALDYYKQALSLWTTLGERTNEAQTLFSIGDVYDNLGERQKALEYYNQALSLYRSMKDRALEGKTLYQVGSIYYKSGEYQKAIEYLNQALTIYKNIENTTGIADTLGYLGTVYGDLSEYQKAIDFYNQALLTYQATGNRAGEGRMLINIGGVYINLRETQKALEHLTQALKIWQDLKDKRGEAFALSNIGNVYKNLSEYQRALNYYNQAISIFKDIGEQDQEAYSLNQIAITYDEMGEMQKSLEAYKQSIAILHSIGNFTREAITLNNIANIYTNIGEYQKALDAYNQALPVFHSINNRWFEAKALSNMGRIYDFLGERQKAFDYYNKALFLHRTVADKEGEAIVLNNLGNFYDNSGEEKAIDYYNEALLLHRSLRNRYQEATTLHNIGRVYDNLGEHKEALKYYNETLLIRRTIGDRYGESSTLNNIGALYNSLGEPQKALENYNQALILRQTIGDRSGEAFTLKNIAGVEAALGNLNQALTQIEAAITIIEKLRTNIASSDLRSSYFATAQDHYGLYIEILMALHRQNPNAGHDIAAFEVSERARARSLIELLNEARVDIRQGLDPELGKKQRQLLQQLNARTRYQLELFKSQFTEEQKQAIRKEIAEIQTQLQEVQNQIRVKNPRYAELTQPQPLTLKEIQQQVVDTNTVLLAYWLGEERSYLWAITPTTINTYVLPKQSEIETAATQFFNFLIDPAETRSKSTKAAAATAALSQMLLGPVVGELGQKRLVIVGDGRLQDIPFSALSAPQRSLNDEVKPLLVEHEIVNLPSASTLALIRRDTAQRQPAPKALAVLADPVFSQDDSRVKGHTQVAAPTTSSQIRQMTRGLDEGSVVSLFGRLPGTEREANQILSLVPESDRFQAFGFAASRETATSPQLSQYRVLHFATHGFFNTVHPELSGIVLSLVNQQGQPQNGLLMTPDIFNLNLPAELIVLSGCQTGQGKEIKGEGLVGLTRGLMYAGASRVIVSLWKVNDQSTAELMSRFYQKMLQEKLPPAAALRAAQISMWQEKSEPDSWAAFILQGEWK